jgi:hypothetical protein
MLQRITTGFTSLTRLERLLQVVQLSDIGEHVSLPNGNSTPHEHLHELGYTWSRGNLL